MGTIRIQIATGLGIFASVGEKSANRTCEFGHLRVSSSMTPPGVAVVRWPKQGLPNAAISRIERIMYAVLKTHPSPF